MMGEAVILDSVLDEPRNRRRTICPKTFPFGQGRTAMSESNSSIVSDIW